MLMYKCITLQKFHMGQTWHGKIFKLTGHIKYNIANLQSVLIYILKFWKCCHVLYKILINRFKPGKNIPKYEGNNMVFSMEKMFHHINVFKEKSNGRPTFFFEVSRISVTAESKPITTVNKIILSSFLLHITLHNLQNFKILLLYIQIFSTFLQSNPVCISLRCVLLSSTGLTQKESMHKTTRLQGN